MKETRSARWKQKFTGWLSILSMLSVVQGCATYSEQMTESKRLLAGGETDAAIRQINTLLEVSNSDDLPEDLDGAKALLLLERATLLQAANDHRGSARDMIVADQRLDWLDLERGNTDEIARYLFRDDAGNYRAPPIERLLLNTLNMVNFLVLGDWESARVEARRFAIMQSFFEEEGQPQLPGLTALGNLFAGLTMEASGRYGDALRFHRKAWQHGLRFDRFCERLAALYQLDRRPIPNGLGGAQELRSCQTTETVSTAASYRKRFVDRHVLVVIQTGLSPYKRPERIPFGVALAYSRLPHGAWTEEERNRANQMMIDGLVKWVSFPALTRRGLPPARTIGVRIGSREAQVHPGMNISTQIELAWKQQDGLVVLAAITRAIARAVAAEGSAAVVDHVAATNDSAFGWITGLLIEGALAAADTPDTRSWTTLPGAIHLALEPFEPDETEITLIVDGREEIVPTTGGRTGLSVINLSAIR